MGILDALQKVIDVLNSVPVQGRDNLEKICVSIKTLEEIKTALESATRKDENNG